MARLMLLLLCSACTASVAVRVSAAPEAGGLRVRFRRAEAGTGGHPAQLEADGGRLEQVLHSPDRLTVSVLWREPSGTLRCAFPYGGVGEFHSASPGEPGEVEYVLLEETDALVECRLPRACTMRPVLPLRILLGPSLLPAQLELAGEDRITISERDTSVAWEIPTDPEGTLVGGDHAFRLQTSDGSSWTFLLSVDPDGTPAATTGFIRNW
jgi:hypothetical protein